MSQKQKIQKMLSPEEMQLLGTLQSTITELLSLNSNEAEQPADEGANDDLAAALKKLAGNANESGEEDQEAQKGNDGPTANETAEQRSEPDSEVNDSNMSEVGKILLNLLAQNNKQAVNKSLQTVNSNQNDIASAIAKSLKPLVDEVSSMKQFNANILDALGFAEKIEKSMPEKNQNVQKGQKPVQSVDATGVVNELVTVIKSLSKQNETDNFQKIDGIPKIGNLQDTRKALKNALPYIFKNSINKNGG